VCVCVYIYIYIYIYVYIYIYIYIYIYTHTRSPELTQAAVSFLTACYGASGRRVALRALGLAPGVGRDGDCLPLCHRSAASGRAVEALGLLV